MYGCCGVGGSAFSSVSDVLLCVLVMCLWLMLLHVSVLLVLLLLSK